MRTPADPLLLCALLLGCAGYESVSDPLRADLDLGAKRAALDGLNAGLGVKAVEDRRIAIGEHTPLLLLERGTLLQAMGQFRYSALDFRAADNHLEVLDLSRDGVGTAMKYLYSDDATLYQAPAYEKALLNTFNLLNYLVQGDLSGARVEARRFTVVERFYRDHEGSERMMGLGAYLAGFVFEHSGRSRAAMRYYAEAGMDGPFAPLRASLIRLHQRSGAWDKRLGAAPTTTEEATRPPSGDLLVVVGTGRAPYRQPERVPLVEAVAYTTGPHCGGHCISKANRAKASRAIAEGLATWVQYPKLQRVRRRITGVQVHSDGKTIPGALGLDVVRLAEKNFEATSGSMIVAAVTRTVTRAIVGNTTEAVVSEMTKEKGGELLGFLAGLALEGALTAADTPDTRSWVSLPGSIFVYRMAVDPGSHRVQILLEGEAGGVMEHQVDVPDGGYGALVSWTLR